MREKLFLTICLLTVLFIVVHTFLLSSNSFPIAHSEVPITLAVMPTKLPMPDENVSFDLVNQYRVAHGLKPLKLSQILCGVALERLPEVEVYFSHDKFLTHAKEVAYTNIGENLAENFTTAEGMVESWINSPKHLANIVSPLYEYSCLKIKGRVAVQMFASFR